MSNIEIFLIPESKVEMVQLKRLLTQVLIDAYCSFDIGRIGSSMLQSCFQVMKQMIRESETGYTLTIKTNRALCFQTAPYI